MIIPLKILGDALSILLLILIIVLIDTFTKWVAISIKFCKDKNYSPSITNVLRSIFFRAWQRGYLESKAYKWAILIKAFAYSIAVFVALVIYLILPEYKINGLYIGETIAVIIYAVVIIAEVFSIAENIKEAGYERSVILSRAMEAVLGKFGINYRDDENSTPKNEEVVERKDIK